MEKPILRVESAITAGTSFVLGLISLQYVWRNGALGAVNFVRVSEGVARTRWWPRKPHQPRVQLATAPALATHNNLKNRIRLQARRGRWGRTTVRTSEIGKSSATASSPRLPLPYVVLMGPACLSFRKWLFDGGSTE